MHDRRKSALAKSSGAALPTGGTLQQSVSPKKATVSTVIELVLSRLEDLGRNKVFGVAGDFAFPIEDAIVKSSGIEWVGCCNELNAGCAADGYARIHGIGALNTPYGVGELSAIGAIAGAYAKHVPIFRMVGMPNLPTRAALDPDRRFLLRAAGSALHGTASLEVCLR